MYQENLFVASARCLGLHIRWEIDPLHPEDRGLLGVYPQWSKIPAAGRGNFAVHLEGQDHQLVPTLIEGALHMMGAPDPERRLPRHLKGLHDQYKAHANQQ